MADPIFRVEMELATGSYTNVTSACQGFAISRALADLDRPLGVGQATLVMDNYQGHFSHNNSASPYYPNLHPGKALRIQALYQEGIIVWTERTNPKSIFLYGIVYGGGLFVAVGSADGADAYIVTSPDGITWTERANPKNTTLRGVAYGGGLFVAVGAAESGDAYIITSSDAVTWTERANPKDLTLYSVAYGGGLFVAVGDPDGATDTYIVTSPDGTTWTERVNPKNVSLNGITYGGNLFVAGGEDDGADAYLITSPDGVTWTERVNPKRTPIRGLVYGGGLYLAGGDVDDVDAYLITSPDGVTWTEQVSGTQATLYGFAHSGMLFVAVGFATVSANLILASPDAVTWTPYVTAKALSSLAVAWGNGVFVVVGVSDGATDTYIVTSPDGTQSLFKGTIDGFRLNPAPEAMTVTVEASDLTKQLRFRDLQLPIRVNYNVGSLFTEVISASGVTSANRIIDAMTDTVPFAWWEHNKPLFALETLTTVGFSRLFVSAAGQLTVKNRTWLYDAAAVGSYSTFLGLEFDHMDDRIENVIRVSGNPRAQATTVQTLAWIQSVPTIAASSWLSFWMTYADPVTAVKPTPANSLVTPVASQDYYTTAGSAGGANRTSTTSVAVAFFATTAVCSLFNASADTIYLTRFQLRGSAIQLQTPIAVATEVSSSIDMYGRREREILSDLIGTVGYAKDYADFLLIDRKDPRDRVSLSVKNLWPGTLVNDLGSVIHVVESASAVGSLFTIQEIEHEVQLQRGLEHVTTYRGDLTPTQNFLELDHATKGKLDDINRLGF